jgi:hypothetical protein
VRATGAERPGWQVRVETPFGHEAIGVLLAPSHNVWRARIVTYPNVLWTAPGGRGTIKFVGETREQAEAQAISFVEEHVRAKRLVRSGDAMPVGPATPLAAEPTARTAYATPRRKTRCLPVRFGTERALTRGMTINVSAVGMFINAAHPEDDGESLLIHLEVDGHTLPMRGLVMWKRPHSELERPVGMGIRLSNPPALYQSYVAALP